MNGVGAIVTLLIVLLILAFCRAVVMWWIGTAEIVQNIKEMKADQKKVIELLQRIADQPAAIQALPVVRPLPVVQPLAPQVPAPVQNPLTAPRLSSRPSIDDNKNEFFR